MTKEEVFGRLKTILAVVRPAVNQDNITYQTDLIKDLGLDSLSMLLMGLALEKEFDIRFANDVQFADVNDVCESIMKLIRE